jgi:membrane-anchored protein YejM (alkaline phosphatase superfamily)
MDHNWGYVFAGYTIVVVTLSAYSTWLWQRLRRARRSAVVEAD